MPYHEQNTDGTDGVVTLMSLADEDSRNSRARILLCAGEAGAVNSGLGVYAKEMAQRLVPLLRDAGFEITVAVPADAISTTQAAREAGGHILLLAPRGIHPFFRLLSHYWRVTRSAGKFDCVYSLDHRMPMLFGGGAMRLFTLHDCCYRVYPKETGLLRQIFFRVTHWMAGWRLDHIITDTKHAAKVIREAYHVAPERISIIPLGFNRKQFSRADDNDAARLKVAYGIEQPGYFLFLGRISPRKNLRLVVEAVEILEREGLSPRVVLAGPPGWRSAQDGQLIEQKGLLHCFRHIGYVDEHVLPALYRHSASLLFPSFCEGFGLPVLEALACGTSVIVARDTAAHEVGDGLVCAIDPLDADNMAHVMRTLMQPVKPPQHQVVQVDTYLDAFSWDRSARLSADIIVGLAGRNRGVSCAVLAE